MLLGMKIYAAVMLTCLFSCSGSAQSVPTEYGAYLKSSDGWQKLYIAPSSGTHSSSAAKVALSYGIASAKSVITYRGSSTPVKTGAKPLFLLAGMSTDVSPRDIVIVRLKQKKDHRELQIGKVNLYSGSRFEYPPEDVFDVNVVEGGSTRTITPETDLKPGEYILFTSQQTGVQLDGYDFTVQAR